MSAGAAVCIIVICLLRLLLKVLRKPTRYASVLWLLALFRLLCPIVPESSFGIMAAVTPWEAEADGADSGKDQEKDGLGWGTTAPEKGNAVGAFAQNPADGDGFTADMGTGNGLPSQDFISDADSAPDTPGMGTVGMPLRTPAFPSYQNTMFRLRTFFPILALLWLLGALIALLVFLIRYGKLAGHLRAAVKVEKGVYLCEGLAGPMVFGIVPKIYLPLDFQSGLEESTYRAVLLHEQAHIKRGDFFLRLALSLALCLHWFNPFVWLMCRLAAKDSEMACDEYVIRKTSYDIRKEYSTCLLEFSVKQSGIMIPLSFGQSNTEARIRNILRSSKARLGISVLALLILVAAGVLLSTNRRSTEGPITNGEKEDVTASGEETESDDEKSGSEGLKETDSEDKIGAADLWHSGESFGEGILLNKWEPIPTGFQDAVGEWLAGELAAAGETYEELRPGNLYYQTSYGSIDYQLLFYLVNGKEGSDRIEARVCRVDMRADLGNFEGEETAYVLTDRGWRLSDEITTAEEFRYYYLPDDNYIYGYYAEILLDYSFPVAVWPEAVPDMTWVWELEKLPERGSREASLQFERLKDPVTACEELLNLSGGSGEVVVDNAFGTIVRYTFLEDGQYIYLRVDKHGINPYDRETPGRWDPDKSPAPYGEIYIACCYYANDLAEWKIALSEEMEALTLETLLNVTEKLEGPWFVGDREKEWFLIEEDADMDAAIYGNGANTLTAVRLGREFAVFPEEWSGMQGSQMQVKAVDYDGDGETEILYKVHLITGTGLSGDILYAADLDTAGWHLYTFWQEWVRLLEERVAAEFDPDTGLLTVFIDGEEMEQKLQVDYWEPEDVYSGMDLGSIFTLEPEETGQACWIVKALISPCFESRGMPGYTEGYLETEIYYEGNGKISIGEIRFLF